MAEIPTNVISRICCVWSVSGCFLSLGAVSAAAAAAVSRLFSSFLLQSVNVVDIYMCAARGPTPVPAAATAVIESPAPLHLIKGTRENYTNVRTSRSKWLRGASCVGHVLTLSELNPPPHTHTHTEKVSTQTLSDSDIV